MPWAAPNAATPDTKAVPAFYELMTVTDEVQNMIHSRASDAEIVAAAERGGLRSMRADGERLVAEGITSLEEVLRVTRE